MKVEECTLSQLLIRKKIFAIPAFQRRYAWRRANFVQLWDDLQEVLDGRRKRHFMGTLVFEPDGPQFSVIDGQQRLVTFVIILKVLEKLYAQFLPSSEKAISKLLVVKGSPLIRPSLYDRPAFDVLFENPALLRKGEHKAVKECYEFFEESLQRYITTVRGQKPSHLKKIYEALTGKMIFVEIVLAHDDDTHAIFETINYAGVPLSAADLARNFVLSRAKNDTEQHRLNQTYWQPLEKTLMESVNGGGVNVRKAEFQKILPEFLRAVLVVEKKKYIGSTDLFRELRAYFRSGSLEKKLSILLEHAEQYKKFSKPALESRDKLSRQLGRMLALRMTTYNPVLLVLFRSNENGGIKTNDLLRALQYVESFIVRRAFNSRVSRDLHKVFAKIAADLSSEKPARLLATLSDRLKAAKWPADSEFRPCFLSSPIYATAPATARFALLSLERHRPVSNEVALDSSVQIEHVFPQGAKAADWDASQMPDLKRRLHVMGNLTLTANNPKLSNHGFHEKRNGKHGFRKSPYWLTKTLSKYGDWTPAIIDKRGEQLLKVALKIWPRP